MTWFAQLAKLAGPELVRLASDEDHRNQRLAAATRAMNMAGSMRGMLKRQPGASATVGATEVPPVPDTQAIVLEMLAAMPSREDLAEALLAVRADADRKLRLCITIGSAGLILNLIVLLALFTR